MPLGQAVKDQLVIDALHIGHDIIDVIGGEVVGEKYTPACAPKLGLDGPGPSPIKPTSDTRLHTSTTPPTVGRQEQDTGPVTIMVRETPAEGSSTTV